VRLRAVLTTAGEVGAPAAPTLRHLARDLRAAELARLMAAAERLPAQLTVPTTLLLLPVTLLLVGAPLVASGLARVLA
jgi:pilus assembly protein TadC